MDCRCNCPYSNWLERLNNQPLTIRGAFSLPINSQHLFSNSRGFDNYILISSPKISTPPIFQTIPLFKQRGFSFVQNICYIPLENIHIFLPLYFTWADSHGLIQIVCVEYGLGNICGMRNILCGICV